MGSGHFDVVVPEIHVAMVMVEVCGRIVANRTNTWICEEVENKGSKLVVFRLVLRRVGQYKTIARALLCKSELR